MRSIGDEGVLEKEGIVGGILHHEDTVLLDRIIAKSMSPGGGIQGQVLFRLEPLSFGIDQCE